MSHSFNNSTVEGLFQDQVRLSPQNTAVAFKGDTLTYQELDQKANQLAHHLQDQGVTTNSLVGVCLDRSIDLIISILAILKAGAAYLPLDKAYPSARLQLMIEDSGASIIITQKNLEQFLPQGNIKRIFLDLEQSTIEEKHHSQSLQQATSESLAYVIYTSGSTGRPKGVAMHHRPLVNLLLWQKQQFKKPQARTLQFTPISFDVSFQEIFSTLCCGGTLVLVEDVERRNSETLLAYLCENSIERLFLPFIALQNLAEAATKVEELPLTLQEVITAGEQLKITCSIASLFSKLKNCTLANQYGPSESHVVTQHILEGPPRAWPHLPPIGKSIDNAEVYLLKVPSRREEDPIILAEPGEVGELAIGGASLAQGYLNRPDLTNERFTKNPFAVGPEAKLYRTGDLVRRSADGNLEFIERLDDQVKIRGVRIEIGEIEAQLSQSSIVKTNVVVARKRTDESTYLAAYIVPSNLNQPQDFSELELELRSDLKGKLPQCMIPTFFEFTSNLPLTPSGKVDRRALPEPKQNRPALEKEYVYPRTEIEKKLAELWSEILEFRKIGIKDNFFELGGDSLRAIQLIHIVRETFKLDLPIITIFDAPTIEELAEKLESIIDAGKTITSDDISPAELESQTIPALPDAPNNQLFRFPKQPQKGLITGVTGFLGVFLLDELLEQTDANIYCLVRASNSEVGKQKIEANLKKYGLWKTGHGDRIQPVLGDLSKPKLGLDDRAFESLSKEIEVIYHNGASISLIHPYSELYAANVKGTEELLIMATRHRLKPFHFISTLDVFQTSESFSREPITESSPLNANEAVRFDGYTKSKWVSEKMVWSAKQAGLPISVYRPAMISGHSQTGICNTGDLMNRLIKGFIQLGAAPKSDMVINVAPVDFFSKGVIYLSRQESSLGKGFNFINPNPVSICQFVQAINACGYSINQVDHEQWKNLLSTNISKVDGIVSVLTAKEHAEKPSYIERSSVNSKSVSCKNVIDGLKDSNIDCPKINADFLKPYFDYFIQTGFVEPPTSISNKQLQLSTI